MRYIILLFAVFAMACKATPVETKSTNNSEISVSKLFDHEGCAVYRFKDNGHLHYYVKCNNGDAQTMTTQNCGKSCSYQDNIITERDTQ